MTTSAAVLDAPTEPLLFADLDLAPGDTRVTFARAVAITGTVLDAVRPEHLRRPTPCDGFDVEHLLRHISAVLPRVASLGRGEPLQGEAFVEGDIAPDEWPALWIEGAREVERVWSDDAVMERTIVLPWDTAPGRDTLAGYTSEITVHTWDIATAMGVQPAWDDDVLAVALTAIQRILPAEGRQEAFDAILGDIPAEHRPPPPFAAAIEVPADAPLIDRLIAHNGRRP